MVGGDALDEDDQPALGEIRTWLLAAFQQGAEVVSAGVFAIADAVDGAAGSGHRAPNGAPR